MEHKANVTRALPYMVALILFLVVTLFCFAPQFQGKELVQHDIMQYEGMTHDILQHRETYGEDPYLTSRMGVMVVKGLQGTNDGKYDKLHACAKHFAVHSGVSGCCSA